MKNTLLFAAIACAILSGCGHETYTPAADAVYAPAEKPNMAQMLSKIDAHINYYPGKTDGRVVKMQNLLSEVSGYFEESETVIGDATCVIITELAKKGIHQSAYETLVDINPKKPMKGLGATYQEFAAMYILMKTSNL